MFSGAQINDWDWHYLQITAFTYHSNYIIWLFKVYRVLTPCNTHFNTVSTRISTQFLHSHFKSVSTFQVSCHAHLSNRYISKWKIIKILVVFRSRNNHPITCHWARIQQQRQRTLSIVWRYSFPQKKVSIGLLI